MTVAYKRNSSAKAITACLIAFGGCAQAQTVDVALQNSSTINSSMLMTAAMQALPAGRAEDAGYLLIVARVRYQIDKQVYPPVKSGGDSPGVLMAALTATAGQPIMEGLQRDPAAMKSVVDRVAKWTPSFVDGYHPGWEYRDPLTKAQAAAVVAATLAEVLTPLKSKATLLENDEYKRLSVELASARDRKDSIFRQMERQRLYVVPEGSRAEFEQAIATINASAERLRQIEWELVPDSRWHARMGWKAEDYFDNPQVAALCHAIEADDVDAMERLIAAGADVNAHGKDGMTPLLWAFPDHRPNRFSCLLEHGADPNVAVDGDFGVKGKSFHRYADGRTMFGDREVHAGMSVTHLACRSPLTEYMKLVFEHGGDANLVDSHTGQAPLDYALERGMPDLKERVDLLVAKGADLNHYCEYSKSYPAMEAVNMNQYALALSVLEAGADPSLYQPDDVRKLIHVVLRAGSRRPSGATKMPPEYERLVEWLEQHGETLEQAREDEARWAKLYERAFEPKDHARIREQIIRQRELQSR